MHGYTWADQGWVELIIFKKLRIRTGSDSIFSDQEWTRTEKFHSPLISASNPSKKQKVSQVQFKTIRALRI